jgi:hypothetical protein
MSTTVKKNIPPSILGRRYRDITGVWHEYKRRQIAADIFFFPSRRSKSIAAIIGMSTAGALVYRQQPFGRPRAQNRPECVPGCSVSPGDFAHPTALFGNWHFYGLGHQEVPIVTKGGTPDSHSAWDWL